MLTTVDGSGWNTTESALSEVAEAILEAWRSSLVVHVAELPLACDRLKYYDHLVELIGTPHELAEDATVGDRNVQRIGQRWMEVRYDPAIPNAYRHSASGQPLHTDGSYIPTFPAATLMFCMSAARAGGETIFLSRDDLLTILDKVDPALLNRLRETPVRHRRSGDEREIPIIRIHNGEALLNWNYFCVDRDASDEVLHLADDFHQFLTENEAISKACVPVGLKPGEAVLWKDDRVLHGRWPFTANEVSERFIWKCAVDVDVWH